MQDWITRYQAWYWSEGVGYGEVVFRLIFAVLCGAIIGSERQRYRKGAGLRTHTLISLGACLFTVIGMKIMEDSGGGDPLRLVQGLLLGVGFLSGGVIVNEGSSVRGMTTAAGLWVMTGVGLAAGMGYYFHAIFATILAFAIMTWVRVGDRSRRRLKRKAGRGGDDA